MLNIIKIIRESKFRHLIWPIRSNELIKFAPMALMMFAILLNQNLVRILKDSIVITSLGSEVINFIKLYGEMPFGLVFVLIYTKLCNIMSTEKVFRLVVIFFLSYFSIFAFFIFPNADFFHPSQDKIDSAISNYKHLKWFIILWGKWTYVTFYIMGELWPIIVFSLLFWQLANKITKTEEASRFYLFFTFFGQSNLLFSGAIIMYFKSQCHCFSFLLLGSTDKNELMIKSLTLVALLSGLVILFLHRFIEKNIVLNKQHHKETPKSLTSLKLGMRESFKMILRSKYLGYICILLVSYGMAVNLIEGVWMSNVRRAYPSAGDFMAYQGNVLFWTGICTLIFAFSGSAIIRYLGWYFAAIVTPFIIMLVGVIFFTFAGFESHLEAIFDGLIYLKPLAILTFVGGLQNALGKGAKYSLFDSTKEMAYIPLNDEMKTKGKAAVDIVGNKLGKSMGALVQSFILIVFPNTNYDDPNLILFLAIVFIAICTIWIFGVKKLSDEYNLIIKKSN